MVVRKVASKNRLVYGGQKQLFKLKTIPFLEATFRTTINKPVFGGEFLGSKSRPVVRSDFSGHQNRACFWRRIF